MGKLAISISVLAVAVSTASVAQAAEAMRCSHQLPPAHHISGVIDRWAEEVGKLKLSAVLSQRFSARLSI